MTNSDEIPGLKLQRTRALAEYNRVNTLITVWETGLSPAEAFTLVEKSHVRPTAGWVPTSARGTARENFYRDAENDFKDTDSNGNYVSPEDC